MVLEDKDSGAMWMNRIVRNHRKEELIEVYQDDPPFDAAIKHNPHRDRYKTLSRLTGTICIFALLYGTSYLALLWLPPYKGVDMRSKLAADYSAWGFLVFQPVDPAVIEEIKQERELPDQVIIDGLFWPTPTSTNTTPLTGSQTPVSTAQVTSDNVSSSPTAAQTSYTVTPLLESTSSLTEPTVTLKPAETPTPAATLNPIKTSKPRKTPKPYKTPKTPKTPKP
jgi:hypothetical protein